MEYIQGCRDKRAGTRMFKGQSQSRNGKGTKSIQECQDETEIVGGGGNIKRKVFSLTSEKYKPSSLLD